MEEMSDINEFMSHFGNGFELKWGLALDPDRSIKGKSNYSCYRLRH